MTPPPPDLEKRVLSALEASKHGPKKPKDLARELKIPTHEYRGLKQALSRLERAGKVYRVKGHRYATTSSIDLVAGVASVTRMGDAFVRPDGGGGDLFVRSTDLASAMDGDRVVVRIEGRPTGRSAVGRVIKVLERARTRIVGTFHRSKRVSFVVPLDPRLGKDVLVPAGADAGAEDGQIVVVRLESYGEGRLGPVGVVDEVLGHMSEPGVDVLAVAHGFGIALDFPADVIRAATEAAAQPLDAASEGRTDLRDLLVFTIDPEDAKDHDDALSFRPLGGGLYEVGVHIADVSYFIPEAGVIDLEALARGTSVYLVDRTVPMLPHELSGGVCSLHEGVDRLAVSLFLTLDTEGRVRDRRYERSTIRCRHGLAYEQAQAVLDGTGSIEPEVDEAIRGLSRLAGAVRAVRAARGSLDLDLPEAKVILDEEGRPTDIRRRERLESHRLIEDFMILANETVAGDAEARGLGVLFRIHEAPTRERVEELSGLLARFGLELPHRKSLKPEHLQALLERVKGRPEGDLVSTVVLRSLKRARYSADNVGHFGLGSPGYLHFTSPIRRYPDLQVHREIVRTLIDGEPPREWDVDSLGGIAGRASAREAAAAEAERASVALKKVEFMERHLGEEFDGKVSGVAAFGFFVTLDRYFVDGLVHVHSMDDDFYRLHEESYALVGDRSRRSYRLGDRVRVQVARVDKEARHIDFVLVQGIRPPD